MPMDSKDTQEKPQQKSSGGLFGSILNKFSFRGKNQMILPDEKNPSVSNMYVLLLLFNISTNISFSFEDPVFFFFSVRSCLEELFSKEYYSSKVL
jgi:hypothetical protein